MKETLIIKNRIDELPVLAVRIEELSEKWELPMALTMNINLVLEEAISNIIFYGFRDSEIHKISVTLLLENKILTIIILDDGIPFDPTAKSKPDVTLPAEDRPIGGLGIFLISKLMDSVNYSRENNRNILTLIKNI
jgi:serine/threonine-protein kinase RsbW